jgi:RNA polymerase-interacting CarD/CdnL/TRCF family regulator
MDTTNTKAILEQVAQIAGAVRALRSHVDEQALQVGDRQYFDRSLDVLESETRALASYLEAMLADSTKA